MTRRGTGVGPDLDLRDLAALDPAGPPDPGAAASAPAQALLARVLATPRGDVALPRSTAAGARPAAAGEPHTPRRDRLRAWSSGRRLVLVGAAAAVLAGAAVVLPGVLRITEQDAYATWTARPGVLNDAATAEAAEGCRAAWRGTTTDPQPTETELTAMRPLAAEQRGDVALVVISDGRWLAECLLDSTGHVAGLTPPDVTAGIRPPADDGVTWSFGSQSRVRDDLVVAAVVGRAGPDVVAVALHPHRPAEGAEVVHATLEDGWFLAFWPARDVAADLMTTRVTLTLRSGEVRHDVVVRFPED